MNELQAYVEALFRHRRATPQVEDLKEEILSNMLAKRDDLIAQGVDEKTATARAKDSLSAVDFLLDGNQMTDVGAYRLECAQTALLNSILFWIFSLPLLFTGFRTVPYLGLFLTVGLGIFYLWQRKQAPHAVAFLSLTASRRRKKIAWLVWGLFFAVCVGIVLALAFGSDLWFGRPLRITGPYQMASLASGIYLPLLTIFLPVTCGSFTKLLLKNRKEGEGNA